MDQVPARNAHEEVPKDLILSSKGPLEDKSVQLMLNVLCTTSSPPQVSDLENVLLAHVGIPALLQAMT